MFGFTRQEKILLVCIALSLLVGLAVKHWRGF
jgi:hypothetical protein